MGNRKTTFILGDELIKSENNKTKAHKSVPNHEFHIFKR